ncbi:hypothetical protein Y032_0018g3514 [Ancylostoma ceylanicum]|uniref:Uncharacterized protein n=1 Tax=Ancylostoma ceylanicum TaxID=53326 RepID=A0A016V2R7_9BILA|nr:hypothetical protein Y032_0018g3514 [Ancylostoma ceylanicum]
MLQIILEFFQVVNTSSKFHVDDFPPHWPTSFSPTVVQQDGRVDSDTGSSRVEDLNPVFCLRVCATIHSAIQLHRCE